MLTPKDHNFGEKWDLRFLAVAKLVSSWSKDPSTQTGAVIVRPDRTMASMGYNGFPQCMDDYNTFYQDREEKLSRIVHCEMNALIFTRELVHGYTLYTYPFASCDRCVVHMLQAGIRRFVFPLLPEMLTERWGDSVNKTVNYVVSCGRSYTVYDFV